VGVEEHEGPQLPAVWKASAAITATCGLLLFVFLLTYSGQPSYADTSARESPLCAAARRWRARYADRHDLQVVVTEVTFQGTPGNFRLEEGAIVAPVAIALQGAQEILDVGGDPAPLRVLRADGVTLLSWAYAGSLYRAIRTTGFALVRREPGRPYVPPASPTFATLPRELAFDATLTAQQLQEHHLARCKSFPDWVASHAGAPPYTEQLQRIVTQLGGTSQREARGDDPCADIRKGRFKVHDAQVFAVMAARQLGAPAFGFFGSDIPHGFLVATYVDGAGWLTLDVTDAAAGYTLGGPGIVSMAPGVGQFEASVDGFWNPAGAAFAEGPTGTSAMSYTNWRARAASEDTTVTHAAPLDEVCP
jgi:hypothetical protein